MAFKTWAAGDQVLAADLNENFSKVPSKVFVASGAISANDKVILTSDGKVQVISGVTATNGTSTSVTASGTIGSVHAAYDSVSGKVIVAYQKNAGTTGQGCAVVGTVSGTTISFGAEAQFNGTFTNNINVCKTGIGSSKFIVAFCNYDTSQQGGIVVGTISGTTITFGSVVAFNAGVATNNISLDWDTGNSKALLVYRSTTAAIKASVVTVSGTVPTVNTAVDIATVNGQLSKTVWTGTSNVFVVAYYDGTNTNGKAVVQTVSGTSSSSGTIATFKSAAVSQSISMTYTTSAKVVIGYQLVSDTSGRAVVGTVSGTTISFGTEATFATGTITNVALAYDAGLARVQVGYYDNTNGKVIIGTISGTSITFGTATTTTASASPYIDSVVYVSSGICVHVHSNSGLKAQVIGTYYTNLTSTNFLGVAQAAAADTANCRVTTMGGFATDSGMTIGTKYYLDDAGAKSTDNTKPYYGYAVSATEICVKMTT